MPRPRRETLQTRLKSHEMQAVREMAEQMKKSLSEFTRDAVLDAIRRARETGEVEPVLGEWRSQVVERQTA